MPFTIDEFRSIMEGTPSAWKGYEEFAFWLVEYLKPKVIVELGVNYGYSLFAMASPGIGHVYGIDLWRSGGKEFDYVTRTKPEDGADFDFANKTKQLFDNVTLIRDSFHAAASTWSQSIDILHIDGMHTLKDVSQDYADWSPFVGEDGVIMFHDIVSYKDEVGRFFDSINTPRAAFVNNSGLGIMAREESLDKIVEKFPELVKG